MRRVCGTKVTRLTLGDLLSCHRLWTPRGGQKGQQKSAEAIVAASHQAVKGRTQGAEPALEVRSAKKDADKTAEMPEQSLRVGDGITEGKATERQT